MRKEKAKIILDTGEEIAEDYVLVARRKKNMSFAGGWFTMGQLAIENIAASDKLTNADLRVFLMLCSVLDFDNYINVCQSDIAKKLNLHAVSVSRSIARLKRAGIIAEGPKVGNSKTYRMNPSVAYRGKPAAHAKSIRKHLKLVSDNAKQS